MGDRKEIRIPAQLVKGEWKYKMPDGGRRVDDEIITTEIKSSKYGVLKQTVERFIIADVPDTVEEELIDEEKKDEEPTPVKKKFKNSEG